jgi:hypothetical protein
MENKEHYMPYPSDIELKMAFAASCIDSAARSTGSTPEMMFQRMAKVNLIDDYILRHYGVLHTESRQNVTEDVLQALEDYEKEAAS